MTERGETEMQGIKVFKKLFPTAQIHIVIAIASSIFFLADAIMALCGESVLGIGFIVPLLLALFMFPQVFIYFVSPEDWILKEEDE